MKKIVVFFGVFVVLCTIQHITAATICRPLSTFKMDCNKCVCSADGKKYSCSNKNCLQEALLDTLKDDYIDDFKTKDDMEDDWSLGLQDVSASSEDDVENIDDLPDNYRFRREIKNVN